MRVTTRMMSEHAITQMSDSLEALNRLQDKVSSGKKFQNPSDDPISASLSLNLKSSLKAMDDYKSTAALANDFMSASEVAFQQMEDLSNRVQTLVQRGLNDTLGANERANSLAPELDTLLNEGVATANASQNGQYVFSGYNVNTPTFVLTNPNTVTYQGSTGLPGDTGIMTRAIGPGKNITINYLGKDVFQSFFNSIIQARNALQANDTTTLRTALGAIQSSLATIDQYRTLNGARLRQVQVAGDYLEKTKLETSSLLDQNENINLAEGITQLKGQETNYQVVLEVSQRVISSMNLFDYLQR